MKMNKLRFEVQFYYEEILLQRMILLSKKLEH